MSCSTFAALATPERKFSSGLLTLATRTDSGLLGLVALSAQPELTCDKEPSTRDSHRSCDSGRLSCEVCVDGLELRTRPYLARHVQVCVGKLWSSRMRQLAGSSNVNVAQNQCIGQSPRLSW